MLSSVISIVVSLAFVAATPDSPANAGDGSLTKVHRPSGDFVSSTGPTISLDQMVGAKGTVYVFLSTECPISNGYTPTLNRLTRDLLDKGIEFLGVNPNVGQGLKEIELHRIRYELVMPVVRDPGARLAESLGITHCPEVIVFDGAGRAVYRGRIDDRYTRRGGAPKPVFNTHDLEVVLDKLAAGETVAPIETEVVGCPVVTRRPDESASSSDAPVTFTRDIARVLQRNCQECHREGGVWPFALDTYDDAVLWADDLVTFTENGAMPPWKLVAGHGEFQSPRLMNDADKKTLAEWVRLGCPKGDAADLPAPMSYPEGWQLGEPDVILAMAEPYELEAEGPDEYRHFVIPTNFDRDVFVTAIEIAIGNPRVDHHTIVFLDPTGVSKKLDAADPSPGYVTSGGWPGYIAPGALGGWAPGLKTTPLPEGVARIIPKGSNIVLQMHYHKSGRPESDLTKIGLYFAKEKPKRLLRDIAITPLSALPMLQSLPIVAGKIPAGEAEFTVRQSLYVPEDIQLITARPHMHLIGKEMKVTAHLPDGTVKPLIYIRNWDFNWQENYAYAEPVLLPKDTRLDLVAVFDNSADNPANPHEPPQDIGWGEETTDEMAFCFFELVPTRDARSDKDLRLSAVTNFMKNFVAYQVRGPHSPLTQFLKNR